MKKTLKWKLILVFVALFIMNTLILAIGIHWTTSNVIRNDSIRFGQLALNQANLNIETYVENYKQFMYKLGVSTPLWKWSHTRADLRGELYTWQLRLDKELITPYMALNKDVVSISIYSAITEKEHHFSNVTYYGRDYSIRQEAWFDAVPLFESVSYYVGRNEHYVTGGGRADPRNVVTLVKRFGVSGEMYVRVDIDTNFFQDVLNKLHLGENGIGFIVNDEGRIIAHPQASQLYEELSSDIYQRMQGETGGGFTVPNLDLTVIFEQIPDNKWYSIITIPIREIASGVNVVRNALIVIAFMNLMISIPLIYFVSSSLTRRLIMLKKSIVKMGNGDFSTPIRMEGGDEISVVAHAYNRMLGELNTHVKDLAEAKTLEQQAVLLSLQMQIDAHFLYNTLEIINSMANKNKSADVNNITWTLAQMLRYTVDVRDKGTTVGSEIEQLNRYLRIVSYRFGSEVPLKLRIENQSLLHAESIKILLQPLAENSILHGGFDEDYLPELELTIAASAVNTLYIRLQDNGKGFHPERLKKLKHMFDRAQLNFNMFHKIGLLNIYYRLTQKWEGVDIRLSNAGDSGGAIVELWFPLVVRQEHSGEMP